MVHREPCAGSLHNQRVVGGLRLVSRGPRVRVDVQARDARPARLAPGLDVRSEVSGEPRRVRAEPGRVQSEQAGSVSRGAGEDGQAVAI